MPLSVFLLPENCKGAAFSFFLFSIFLSYIFFFFTAESAEAAILLLLLTVTHPSCKVEKMNVTIKSHENNVLKIQVFTRFYKIGKQIQFNIALLISQFNVYHNYLRNMMILSVVDTLLQEKKQVLELYSPFFPGCILQEKKKLS